MAGIAAAVFAMHFAFRGDVEAILRDLERFGEFPLFVTLAAVLGVVVGPRYRVRVGSWARARWERLAPATREWIAAADVQAVWVLGLVAFVLALYFGADVLGGVPHDPHDVADHLQARLFASGRLFAPTHPLADFFRQRFVVDDGRTYGAGAPGWALLLAAGIAVGAPSMINAALSGALVLVTFALGRQTAGRAMGLLAAALVALSPFVAVTGGRMTAQPLCAVLTALAALGGLMAARAARERRPYDKWLLVAGAAVGGLVLCGPEQAPIALALIAVAFAIERRVPRGARALGGFALPVLAALFVAGAYNAAVTGSVWTTPARRYFDLTVPGDFSFDRAVEITHQGFDALKGDLFGPGVAALLVILPLAIPAVRRRAWIPIVGVAAQIALDFGTGHAESPAGARGYFAAMPFVALLMAHGTVAPFALAPGRFLFSRVPRRALAALGVAGCTLSVAAAVFHELPERAASLTAHDATAPIVRATREAGVLADGAMVFVAASADLPTPAADPFDRRDTAFGAAFVLNPPDILRDAEGTDVLYARDLTAQNAQLFAFYPRRRFFRYAHGGRLVPIAPAADPGAIAFEGETKFPPVRRDGGYAFVVDTRRMGRAMASQGAVLWMRVDRRDAYFEVRQYVPEEGSYLAEAALGSGSNFGPVRVSIDGRAIGPVFDGGAERFAVLVWQAAEPIALRRGVHRIRFALAAPNARDRAAAGRSMPLALALDRFVLRRAGGATPVSPPSLLPGAP